jgi:hypothetical protein
MAHSYAAARAVLSSVDKEAKSDGISVEPEHAGLDAMVVELEAGIDVATHSCQRATVERDEARNYRARFDRTPHRKQRAWTDSDFGYRAPEKCGTPVAIGQRFFP